MGRRLARRAPLAGYTRVLSWMAFHATFDRMLIAQALAQDLELVSNEEVFGWYGVNRMW